MGMLDWIGDFASSAVDTVSDVVATGWDWVTDLFYDDSDEVDKDVEWYSDSDLADGDIDEFDLDTEDYLFTSEETENILDGKDDGGILSSLSDALGENSLGEYNKKLDAADVTTEKSALFSESLSGDGKKKLPGAKDDDEDDKSWWGQLKDFAKSEGGAALIGGAVKGGAAMLTDGDDQEDAIALLQKKADLEKELYSYKDTVDAARKAANSSSSSSSSKSSSSDETSSGSDRIATLAAAYPVKSNFTRS